MTWSHALFTLAGGSLGGGAAGTLYLILRASAIGSRERWADHASCHGQINTLRRERDEAREEATAMRADRDVANERLRKIRASFKAAVASLPLGDAEGRP